MIDRIAEFRLVTPYVPESPPIALLDANGFREGSQGANVWLAVPHDEGVFHGVRDTDGVRCVHPVQAYLDLQDRPERATEAGEQVRERLLDLAGTDDG